MKVTLLTDIFLRSWDSFKISSDFFEYFEVS